MISRPLGLTPADAALTGVLVFATAIWVGGYVAITVFARVAARTPPQPVRVVFLRRLGRAYGILGSAALLTAGMVQARRMTRMRRSAL